MIFLFTGDGKGKTTSAIGMGVRAVGAGRKVLMIQFMKSGDSSEIKTIKEMDNFQVESFGGKKFIDKNNNSKEDLLLAKKAFERTKKAVKKGECDLLILDEIAIALYFDLLDSKEILSFLKENGKKMDIVLTGRKCPEEIKEIADLATECREVKHYYSKGVMPRKGIEY